MNADTGPVLNTRTWRGDTLRCGDGGIFAEKRMFAANLLNKLSSKYWDNVQKLRNNRENGLDFDDNYHFTEEYMHFLEVI